MRVHDLHSIPKFKDQWSYLYVEHCKIDQEEKAIAIHDIHGKVPVPCANVGLIMLGPGVSITHAAVTVLAEHGCLIAWCGEQSVRCYAFGTGTKRKTTNMLHQINLWANLDTRMQVVRMLYQHRFSEILSPNLTLREIRGKEGIRVRHAYECAAKQFGLAWSGRKYDVKNWNQSDPLNKAISAANACLYGVVHTAVLAAGFLPALGFIHTGSMASFVYDIADLYKTDVSIPVAFKTVAEGVGDLDRRVRYACRDYFFNTKLMARIIPDIQHVLFLEPEKSEVEVSDKDSDQPDVLWDPEINNTPGGTDYSMTDVKQETLDHDSAHL